MSLAMRQARSYAVGDPGLFGFVGKALGAIGRTALGAAGGFLSGGPVGAIAGGVSALPKSVSMAKTSSPLVSSVAPRPLFQPVSATPSLPGIGVARVGPSPIPMLPQQYGPQQVPTRTSGALVGTGAGTPCTSGYHYNKTAYYTQRYGVVAKGSVCVKNRRRNPLNPRALSRAMSRVKSAQKAVRCLQLFAGPAARASSKSGGRFKKGCKSCRR